MIDRSFPKGKERFCAARGMCETGMPGLGFLANKEITVDMFHFVCYHAENEHAPPERNQV